MQEAAVALFLERGFDGTTAAEISARAGVTERTFFRYFPDKRDVLFDEAELNARLHAAIDDAPPALGPLDVVSWAFQAIVSLFEDNRPLSEPAQAVIARTPTLQERQLTKTATLTLAVSEALRRRGVDPALSRLAAAAGMAVAAHALRAWFEDPSLPLVEQFARAFQALKGLATPAP